MDRRAPSRGVTSLDSRPAARPPAVTVSTPDRGGHWQLLSGGDWRRGTELGEVVDPDTGETVAQTSLAGLADMDIAVSGAWLALRAHDWTPHERHNVLQAAATCVHAAAEQFAQVVSTEGIKTISEARPEVERAVKTLQLSADAALTLEHDLSHAGF